jgi:indole-3-glycerol phosphate synthase
VTILEEIFAHKRVEVERQRSLRPLTEVRASAEKTAGALNFTAALRRAEGQRPALIAEVKCASPSRGLLAASFDPIGLAQTYQQNGASAISVLTDERYFKGSLAYLSQIAALQPRLPLLRKDFILDPYQVYEARAAGADALLLIAAYLEPGLLADLHALTGELGMAALVEVHSEGEMETALKSCQPGLLGINNRDLRDFSVSLATTWRLAPLAPAGACLVAESGIHTPADVEDVMTAGIDAVLVGEALVTAAEPAAKVRSLAR